MKRPLPPRFDVSDDGAWVDITVDCSPVSQPHTARVSFPQVWDVALAMRARQLGADSGGNL